MAERGRAEELDAAVLLGRSLHAAHVHRPGVDAPAINGNWISSHMTFTAPVGPQVEVLIFGHTFTRTTHFQTAAAFLAKSTRGETATHVAGWTLQAASTNCAMPGNTKDATLYCEPASRPIVARIVPQASLIAARVREPSLVVLVGGTGIEPVTSSVSGKRSPAELTAPEAEAGIEPAYRALQALA
jgi:hypothetical protein